MIYHIENFQGFWILFNSSIYFYPHLFFLQCLTQYQFCFYWVSLELIVQNITIPSLYTIDSTLNPGHWILFLFLSLWLQGICVHLCSFISLFLWPYTYTPALTIMDNSLSSVFLGLVIDWISEEALHIGFYTHSLHGINDKTFLETSCVPLSRRGLGKRPSIQHLFGEDALVDTGVKTKMCPTSCNVLWTPNICCSRGLQ